MTTVGRLVIILLFSMLRHYAFAQAQEEEPRDGVKVSGNFSMNNILYSANGMQYRRDPYSVFMVGNLDMDIFGVSTPLSFSYTNQEISGRQPFNQIGISPRYKWLTGHLGYRNLVYSPYTLNGHVFLGVGVDVEPTDNWHGSIMYGRLNRAIEPEEGLLPFYRRMGGGAKVGYKDENGALGVMMFRSGDDPNSLENRPDQLGVLPEQNMVWSIQGARKFGRLRLSSEFARSALTRDVRAGDEDAGLRNGIDRIFLIPYRTSTSFHNAFRINAIYDLSRFDIGLGYERVDPGYRTHGAYFFNNDLENLTVHFSTDLLQRKLTIVSDLGGQRNLADGHLARMNRFVGSVNVAVIPNKRWTNNLSFSNFQTYTFILPAVEQAMQVTPFDNIDTLNFVQISSNASISSSYTLKADKEINRSVSLIGSYQRTSDRNGEHRIGSGTSIYNLALGYNHLLVQQNLNFRFGFNSNLMDGIFGTSTLVGTTIGAGKAFLQRRLRTNVSLAWNNNYDNGANTGRILTSRLNGTYRYRKQHNFSGNLIYVDRKKLGEGIHGVFNRSFSEFTFIFGYALSF